MPSKDNSTAGSYALSAGTPAPAGAVNPGGTLCQSHQTTRKNATKIRPDYVRHPRWTYLEAAHFAGVDVNTVRVWACRKKFKPGFAVGSLRVDAASFQKFLNTGKAQQ